MMMLTKKFIDLICSLLFYLKLIFILIPVLEMHGEERVNILQIEILLKYIYGFLLINIRN